MKLTITNECSNNGIAREWAFARAMGIERTSHDNGRYDKDSDVNANGIGYSVKASGFSLMSGTLCEGKTEFDEIWKLYKARVHSTRFVYVTKDGIAYIMNINEFEKFVYEFCKVEKESQKNGGYSKIRCKKESNKMVEWLSKNA